MSKNPTARFVLSAYGLEQAPKDRKPHIAFGGRSNVGKSTLINTILGQKRLAKTSSTPGRTQALNFFEIDDRYYFVDLPGYGFAKAPLVVKEAWGKLVDSYLSENADLTGVVSLWDARHDPSKQDLEFLGWLQERKLNFLIVLTKADKLKRSHQVQLMQKVTSKFGVEPLLFSSVEGTGKRELWRWIENTLNA
jgi:GTP-binding protein